MNLHRLVLTNFTTHTKTEIDFPEKGLLLVTGENGAGKSSIVEAPAWAGWGKTLRGDVPWRGDAKDEPCKAVMTTEDFFIARGRKGGKNELDWTALDGDACDAPGSRSDDPEFETPSKAQEALAQMMGSFDLWRRCHVFSASDAAHFSTATDGDRKRLIETFLGNDRFDPALKKCREDLRAAEDLVKDLQRRQEVSQAKLDGAKQLVTSAKLSLTSLVEPTYEAQETSTKTTAEVDELLGLARRELAAARGKVGAAQRAGGEFEVAARQAQSMLDRLRADSCPTCTQAITPAFRQRLHVEAKRGKDSADKAKADAAVGLDEVEALIEELEDEIGLLTQKRTSIQNELARQRNAQDDRHRYIREKERLEKVLADSEQTISIINDGLCSIEEDLDVALADAGELHEVERVLGLKGVRAHILGRSLVGIEAVANVWLARMHDHVTVSLKPYSEKGVQDSISLEVQGLGRGSYKSTSAGERRRVDIALLLGLAEVAAASRGREAGTLFFDEVFDCLDEEGTDAVVEVLRELSETRCVVVITHSQLLIERLPGARHLRMAQGRLVELG